MKKKDEDAFLKSVYGASPIKKNDKVEKKIQNVLKNKKQNKNIYRVEHVPKPAILAQANLSVWNTELA